LRILLSAPEAVRHDRLENAVDVVFQFCQAVLAQLDRAPEGHSALARRLQCAQA
jgi:hypothetical protein